MNKPIIFIDSSIENYPSLITGADKNAQIVILEKDRSGVEQITQALRSLSNIKALHLVSHGSQGSLQLGSDILNGENLDSFSSLLQWGKALAKKADILVYGCEVAAGKIGEKFISRLNKIIGANIAASSHKIGNARLGGDWKLDKTIGSIQTPLAFSAPAIKSYAGVLATANFNVISIFTHDVIVNYTGGVTDTTQNSLSNWSETLVTQSFATFKAGANGNGLPDNGLFAANSYHPNIQLGYSNTSDGNNAKVLSANNTSFTFNITSGQYSAIHLFATSADGTAGIEVKFNYSDGTNEAKTATVPDWFDTISETSDKYYLIDGMDRSFDTTGSNYDDANTVALYGLKFAPNSAKTLSSITFTKTSGSMATNWVSFFGATGEYNNAPVLNGANVSSLAAISEDPTTNPGTLVSTFLSSGFTDANSDPSGIAVTSLSNTTDGTWQFSSDNGSNWTTFGAVTDSSATLLSNTALVRFVPNANFNGNVSLTYRGWDSTSGSNGQTGVNVSTNGGITAFSTATATSNLSITNVNDLPTGNVSITGTATQNQILTATNTLADVDGLGTFNYQWQESSDNGVTWTNISGATNNTFTLSQTQVGKTIQAKVSYTDLLGTSETVNSTPTATVANVNDLPTGNVSITGTATQNQILTATNTLADADGLGTLNYQWQQSADNGVTWTNISGATNNTFTLSQTQVGKKVQVKVSYTDLLGTAETVNSSPTSVVTNINDLPTGNVSITGTATQNQILTATNTLADADGLGTFNYQWQESSDNGVTWTNISGATNNTFTLSQTQVGKKVQVKVSYTDLLGTAETVNSSPTSAVAAILNNVPTGNVSITGTATQNQILTATNTLADVDGLGTLNYQWQESADNGVTWTNISGATNNTFTLSQTQVGKKVQAKVSYTDGLGTVETVNSSPTSAVAALLNNIPTGNVSITGTATQNQILTATNTLADVDGLGTFNYQWQESADNGVTWTNISGATNNTFALSQTQVGKKVQVKVSYTDLLGTQETVNSTPTATVTNVNDLPTGNVSITGTATQNQILTATNTLADVDGLGTLNYQWQDSSDNGVTWTNISGATNNTFALSQAQVGKKVQAKVSYTDGQGTAETVNSTPTATVTNVNHAPVLDNTNFTYSLTPINEDDSNSSGDAVGNIIPASIIKENTNVSLSGVYWGSVTTADFDKDGDTDILLTGWSGSGPISKIYSNNGSGGFSENTNVSLTGVYRSSVTTADFDKDGDTDILLTGSDSSYNPISKIYSNNGSGGFSENTNVSLTGVYLSSVTTADFDNDGNTDILLTGWDSSWNPISKIYSNNGSGGFSENTNVSLTGVYFSSVTTADFDNDGNTDILLTGWSGSWNPISKIYSNNGSGGFSQNTNVSLTGVYQSSVTTADFDNDGNTDILLTGEDSSGNPISKIYSNNGSGGFSENTKVSLSGVFYSSVTTADFDNDGDTDILLTGKDSSWNPISKIYSNNGSGGFSENTNVSLTGVYRSSVTTADFNKDGYTDILLTGKDSSGNPISKIYNNLLPISDVDTNPTITEAIAITAADKNGTWQYSTDNGTNWTNFPTVSNSNALLLDAGNKVRFQPNADYNGTVTTALSFRAWDQSTGTAGTTADTRINGGTTAFSTNTATASIVVTAFNNAPTATDKTLTVNEDNPCTFTTADFGFSDLDTEDILASIKITQLPTVGTLQLNGTAVTANQVITAVDIPNLVFTPVANANGSGYANFKFTVNDGTIDSVAANTITIDVNNVNDAPTATTITNQTATKDSSFSLNIANNFSDIDPGDTLTYSATLADGKPLPSWLTFNTTTGAFTGTPTNADIGNITIKVTAKDSSNATVENSFQLTVNNTNTPPTATNKTLTVNEDNPYTFAATDFGFSDVDTTDTLASIKITQLPTVGTLQLNGAAVTANQVITAVDIPNLKFTPVANANGSGYANFKFTVNDGTIDSVAANTITIDVTAVNDLPTGNVSITGTATKNQTLTVATNTLGDADGLGTLNYQWQESADNGVTWTNIGEATHNTFTLSQTQVGKQVQAKVTYTDGKETLETVMSTPTSAVTTESTPISVTQALDNGKGDTQGTLSWAIDQANKTAGADTIKLNTDVRLNFGDDVIRMWSLIDSDVTVDGQAHTINGDKNNNGSADKDDRPIFFVKSGNVSFKNLTLKNAVAKGGDGYLSGGGAGMGGALFIYQGNVTVDGVKFEGNQAIGGNATGGNQQFGGGIGLQKISCYAA